MPVNILTNRMKVRSNGQYVNIDFVADATTQERISQINSTGANKVAEVNAAGATKVSEVNSAGSSRVSEINTAGAIQVSNVETKGQEVLDSIPDEYQDLSKAVDVLQEGNAEQLIGDVTVSDSELYSYRKTLSIVTRENRKRNKKIVGGTVCWNQLARDPNMEENDTWASSNAFGQITIENNLLTFTIKSAGTKALRNTTSTVKPAPNHKYLGLALCNPSVKMKMRFMSSADAGGACANLRTIELEPNTWTTYDIVFEIGESSTVDYFLLYVDTSGIASIDDTVSIKTINIFDLTQMFGSTVADYIYALDQTTPGAGMAWFKSLFPNDYYAYNAGTMMHVNVAEHVTTGFNLWDEELEVGTINSNGQNASSTTKTRSKNYIPVIGGREYYFGCSQNVSTNIWLYDKNKECLGRVNNSAVNINNVYSLSDNVAFIRFDLAASYGLVYNYDICINFSDPDCNGKYEPSDYHTYLYDSTVELKGIPKLVDGELTYDGDIYEPDGTVIRKYGMVDLGTLTWSMNTNYTNTIMISDSIKENVVAIPSSLNNAFLPRYTPISGNAATVGEASNDKVFTIAGSGTQGRIAIRDDSYTDADTFKTAMSGVYLVYELATPTIESAESYNAIQYVSAYGTEEFVDAGVKAGTRDVSIPVGHETEYLENLQDKATALPSRAVQNGDYVIRQTDDKMSLYPLSVVDTAMQLNSEKYTVDQTPYVFRQTGGGVDVGTRAIEQIVGGTVCWNQIFDTSKCYAVNGVFTIDNNNIIFTLNSNNTAARLDLRDINNIVKGHRYLITGLIESQKKTTITFQCSDGTNSASILSNTSIEGIEKISKIFTFEWDMTVLRMYVNRNAQLEADDTVLFKSFVIFDLTAMFGSTIADYIYSLEQTTAGAGIAFFRSLFPNDYYEYNSGELMSVKVLRHETVGRNLICATTYNGAYNATVGDSLKVGTAQDYNIDSTGKLTVNVATNWRGLLFVTPTLTKDSYVIPYQISSSSNIRASIYITDKDLRVVQTIGNRASKGGYNAVAINVEDGQRIAYSIGSSTVGAVTVTDFYLRRLSARDEFPYVYEPYSKRVYPLDQSLELRGIPKLDSDNKLYYDGDTYNADGTVTRRYGIITLDGSSDETSWTLAAAYNGSNYMHNFFRFTLKNSKIYSGSGPSLANGLHSTWALSKYIADDSEDNEWTIRHAGGSSNIYILSPTSVGDMTLNKFKTYLATNPITIVYELETPTTEQVEPYQEVQVIDPYGMEEYIDAGVEAGERDVAIPVGHVTKYPVDQVKKLDGLPSNFSTLIAPNEKTTMASQNYAVGSFLIMDNQLYKVTSAITTDNTITPGTNVQATTIMQQIMALQ